MNPKSNPPIHDLQTGLDIHAPGAEPTSYFDMELNEENRAQAIAFLKEQKAKLEAAAADTLTQYPMLAGDKLFEARMEKGIYAVIRDFDQMIKNLEGE